MDDPLVTPTTSGAPSRRTSVDTVIEPWAAVKRLKRKSHRFTPYQESPVCRTIRRRTNTGRPPQRQTETDRKTLQEVVNKTWRVYRVSCLYNLSKTATDLKAYARAFSAHVKTESLKGLAAAAESERADSATFVLNKTLRLIPNGHEALEIHLRQKPKKGTGPEIEVLMALLMGITEETTDGSSVSDKFSQLPIMLVKGPLGLTDNLITWIQGQFDCVVSPMLFTPSMLCWMVAMFAGYTPAKKRGKQVELVFKVPPEVEGLSKITMSISGKNCKDLVDSIHNEGEDDFQQEEVVAFMKSLEAHFYHHFKLHLDAMLLIRIGTSVLYAGNEGKIKIFSEDHVMLVLKLLTDFALECRLNI